jgi:GAF domain-containing protein
MSLPQPSEITQAPSFAQRARKLWQQLIEPDASIKEIAEFRRAQLLAAFTLIITIVFIIILLFFGSKSLGIFFGLGAVTVVSYVLSRTRYYAAGIYLFTFGFTAIGYLRIYEGSASSVEASVFSTVLIAIVFSSALLSQRGFLILAVLATLAASTIRLYSKVPILETESIALIGGVVFMISTILYGAQVFRANLDREQLKKLTGTNRELEELTSNLEQRIAARTADLAGANQKVEERAARFQVISEISQEISSNVDQQPQELLNQIARSISQKLGFYHVGIFLLDDIQEYAVLRASNSPGGQHMLERRHQLRVGGTGIVGYVSQSGRPRIALDTGTDAVFFNNPDLPETRSEIALPLKYGPRTIGVLDVQSTLASAFKDEDANLLITLANQLAIVINNVLSMEKPESQKTAKPDSGRRDQRGQGGYSYLPDGTISNAIPANNPTVDRAIASGEIVIQSSPSRGKAAALAIPVKFRDQVIGIIQIEASEADRRWTENEIALFQAISDRAAIALENARLFEDTVRRADQEQTIARVTTQIGASTDFNRILQTTIQELGHVLGTSRSYIQLGTYLETETEKDTDLNTAG